MISPGAEGQERPLLIVIPASSGDASAPQPAYLRPIAGRPQLAYVLDAAAEAAPGDLADIVVFAHATDPRIQQDLRAVTADRGSLVLGTGDPASFVGELLEYLRGRPGDILFISATAAPLDGAFLTRFVHDCRQKPRAAFRVEASGPGRAGKTALLFADATLAADIRTAPDDPAADFSGRVFSALKGAAPAAAAADYDPDRQVPVGDVTSARDFAAALRAIRAAVAGRLMDGGVTIIDPDRTYVDWGVTVGPGTTLYPDTYLEGATSLGDGCVIEPNVKITDSTLGRGVLVKMCSVITESVIDDETQIGPFAHLRPKTHLGRGVKIGNFVEVKKSTVGEGSKASHLSYIGDALIGARVNVGAGTITCNYDGVAKHTTTIGDGVFIGSDTQFIAPVTVGDNSLIGAGSTITKDVPPDALAVSRAKQVNLPGRGVKSRKKHKS
jgi:bifunctional N-acetylglucosamine-1-phosphate-uridyltransferase/glucosamine-1-phosphate-acetyltransferase GlmU-like protein